MEFQSRNMQEQEEIRKMLLTECEQCRVHSDQQPRNDKLIAHWGAMLLQLAVITEDVPGKHELLKDSRAKLQRAIDINPNSITPDGQLCLFHLANAFYMTYIFEEDDAQAEKYLQKCTQLVQKGRKKDPKNTVMLNQIKDAPLQRDECLKAAKRFQGKTKEGQQLELVKMGQEKCEHLEAMLAARPDDAGVLKQYGSQLLELSLLTESHDVLGAREDVVKAMHMLKKSSELHKDQQCLTMLSLATNAVAMLEEDAGTAHALLQQARKSFSQAISLEENAEQLALMLMQFRDMYATNYQWREQHPKHALKMPIDVVPADLASLPPTESTWPELLASSPPPAKAAEGEGSPGAGKRAKKGAKKENGGKAGEAKKGAEGGSSKARSLGAPTESNGKATKTPAQDGEAAAEEGAGEGEGEAKKKKKNKNRRRKKAGAGDDDGAGGGRVLFGLGWGGVGMVTVCAAAAALVLLRARHARAAAA